jgi:hypothetical protein
MRRPLVLCLAVLAAAALYAPSRAADPATLAVLSTSQLTRAITEPQTRSAVITAYELEPRGAMVRALTTLCQRGGRADVMLANPRDVVGGTVVRKNQISQAALESAGCHVRFADRPLHLKLADVDGVTYLADRNFGRSATILRTDVGADRSAIARTLSQDRGVDAGDLSTRKASALAIEADVILRSTGSLGVETESFGPGTQVYEALRRSALARRPVYLIVARTEFDGDDRERSSLSALAAAGVHVRVGDSNAKLAVAQGGPTWIGSANATAGRPDQIDWGRRIDAPVVHDAILRRFLEDWNDAQDVRL